MASDLMERLQKRVDRARAALEKAKDKGLSEQRAARKKVKRALRKLAKTKFGRDLRAKKSSKESS